MCSNAFVHRRSTRNAMAYDRNRSNISGVRIAANEGSSTRRRNSSNPSTRSRARAPATVRAAILSLDLGAFTASARWQFGSGLPFTRPFGFDEAFDFTRDLYPVTTSVGTTRLLLDKPFTGRLPLVHRLDLSLERAFDVAFGQIVLQAGVINAYDRRNMFYYDLFSGRRLDQLPLAPYASVTLRSR
jgi:hypothetical protein